MQLHPFVRAAAAACAVLLAAGCAGGSSAGPTGSTIKIGIDLPLSGTDATVGQSTLNGAVLAVEQANAKGLPGGFKIELDQLDDTVQGVHNPQQGVTNARTFISDPNVLVMLGPYNSNVGKAEIPVTNAAGLTQISPATTADSLTLGADAAALRRANPVNSFFRTCTTDSRQGSAGATFAQHLGWKTAYIVDDNETYGLDLSSVFAADFQKAGGKIIAQDHLAANTQDFKSLLLKIAAAKPEMLYYGGVTSTGGGLMRQQMFDTGLGSMPFMGGDGIVDLATVAGKAADGTYFTVAAPNAEKLPAAQTFVKDYVARFHEPVGPYSANAFVAAQVAIAAILSAAAENKGALPTRAAVLAKVAATDMPSAVGRVRFDSAGDIRNPVISLYGFKNGKEAFIKQISLPN